MASKVYYSPFIPAFSANGLPVAAARLYFFYTGTNTPAPVFLDGAMTVPSANPVVADLAARFSDIYLDDSVTYRVRMTDAAGAALGADIDPYIPGAALKGDPGPTGPSNNTRVSLAALKAAATSDMTSLWDGSLWTWNTGDYTARQAAFPDYYVKADSTSIASGAWVRQPSEKLAYVAANGTKSVQAKLAERITTSDYATLQAAIDTGAGEVVVNTAVTVSADIALRSNQTLRFDGGSITVSAGATITNAVLYAASRQNVRIINPVINASAGPGVQGIRLYNTTGAVIDGGKLTKALVNIESNDNTVDRATTVSNLTIDMASYASTAVYISGAKGVLLSGVTTYSGREGVGIYNAARSIRHVGCVSRNHTQDGFVVIAGQDISYSICDSYSNGQSGFTTQRMTAGTDTRFVTWSGCKAWSNAYDGFDIRGKNAGPQWGIDTGFTLNSCTARANAGCGFYIVLAEATTLNGCNAVLNVLQSYFIDTSDRVVANGCRSISGASGVAAGANRAGFLVYNSDLVQIQSPISNNSEGATQSYGLSFTGTSANGHVVGGDLSNNSTGPFVAGSNAVIGAAADTLSGSGVFFLAVSSRGIYEEEGYGAPTHLRPLGSKFQRLDGGSELYISTSAGVTPAWRSI